MEHFQLSEKKQRRPSQQPMFYAAIALALGIVCANHDFSSAAFLVFSICALIALAIVAARTSPNQAFASSLIALSVLGVLLTRADLISRPPAPDLSQFTDDVVTVTGHVTRSGLVKSGDAFFRSGHNAKHELRQSIDVETEQISSGEPANPVPLKLGIRVTIYSGTAKEGSLRNFVPELASAAANNSIPLFLYGDRIEFPAKLREPHNYGDPGAMDYRGYLRDKGISALASVKSDRIRRFPGFSGSMLGRWRSIVRRSLVDHMLDLASPRRHGIFFLNEQDGAVLSAMVLGEQSLIQRAAREDFQRTGTYHILVVSGMNVAILAFAVFWLAKRFRASEIVATIVTVVLTLLYAYLTDLGPPIVRAALMLSLYLSARLLYRDRFSLNSIGTAAFLMLMAWPQALFEASFQMTFLSVIVLSGIVQPLLERTTAPYKKAISGLGLSGYDTVLEPKLAQFRLDLRMISARLARFLYLKWLRWFKRSDADIQVLRLRVSQWTVTSVVSAGIALFDLILVTTIIQLALALPMVIYFHRLAMLGVPSNMVIVPLTAILMPLAIATTLISYVSHAFAIVPVVFTALLLHGITGTVSHFGGMHFAEVRIAEPRTVICWAAALSVVLCMIAVHGRKRLPAFAGIFALILGAAALALPSHPRFRHGVMELTAIDVGQGDSILIISPDGHSLLIDGGGPVGGMHSDSFDIGEDVVSPYLWSRGISHLDAIALTHAHSDHLGGLFSVMANFRPEQLWVGKNPLSKSYRRLLAQAEDQHVKIDRYLDGDEFKFGGLHLRVLSPTPDFIPGPQAKNDDSLVMEISYRDTSALLAGDVEKKIERRIATEAHHSELLKVAHHGSATSTTPELLQAVKPQFAVISVGYKSIFGHPKPIVLARLAAAHVRTYRTDLQGAITFYLDGQHVMPATY